MINQYYCIFFYRMTISLLHSFWVLLFFWTFWFVIAKWILKIFLAFHDYVLQSNFHGSLFWHRKILSSYFLLLSLSSMVRFSQNKNVLQLAECLSVSYDVGSLFLYYFVQDTKCLNMSNDKSIYQWLRLPFPPSSLRQPLYSLIA